MLRVVAWIFLFGSLPSILSINNGLALTPPMGWMSWQRYECTIDCEKYPRDCLSEDLIKRTVDKMVSDGYRDAGYEYVIIDDCWLEKTRGPDGRMVPDGKRFKSGMKSLADYIHGKGLKFGMYQDYGNYTCQLYPGMLGYEQIDIDSFVEWEIDYLKVDGCSHGKMEIGYPAIGKMLNESGRPIVYSCSWPAYEDDPNYPVIAEHCNLWRNWDDIYDEWSSLTTIMDWFGDKQNDFASLAGPGNWNDPDMLIIGDFGLSIDQARVQMAVWAVMAAPLIMSVDLDDIRPEFKEILLNRDIIDVDQDKLGKQGLRVFKYKKIEVWTRELHDGYALAFLNRYESGIPLYRQFNFTEMAIPEGRYVVQDLYKEDRTQILEATSDFSCRINPSGVKFYKFTPRDRQEKKVDNNISLNVITDN